MPYCSECGSEVGEASEFCVNCGASLSNTPTGGGAPRTESAQSRSQTGTERQRVDQTGAQTARGGAQPNQQSGSVDALQGRFLINSVLGGVLGFVAGSVLVTLFAPVYFVGVMLGAGAGGFFQNDGSGSGAIVGGLAGILATIPFVILLVAFILYGFGWFALQDVSTQLESESFFIGLNTIITVISVFAFIVNGICGVIGGLIGGSVAS